MNMPMKQTRVVGECQILELILIWLDAVPLVKSFFNYQLSFMRKVLGKLLIFLTRKRPNQRLAATTIGILKSLFQPSGMALA